VDFKIVTASHKDRVNGANPRRERHESPDECSTKGMDIESKSFELDPIASPDILFVNVIDPIKFPQFPKDFYLNFKNFPFSKRALDSSFKKSPQAGRNMLPRSIIQYYVSSDCNTQQKPSYKYYYLRCKSSASQAPPCKY
jgi:hypothetical protein